MKRCSQCDREYDDSMRFCPNCGSPLPSAETEPLPAENEPAAAPESSVERGMPEPTWPEPISESRDAAEAPEEAPLTDQAAAPPWSAPPPWESAPEEPPQAPEEESKKAKKARKEPKRRERNVPGDGPEKGRGDKPLNFGLRLVGVALCIVLFCLLLASSLIYDIRDYSAESQLYDLLRTVKASSVMASDLNPAAVERQRLSQRIVDLLDEHVGDLLPLTSREMETFLDKSTFKDSLAEKSADFLKDIYAGKTTAEIDRVDITDLLKDNEAFFADEFDIKMDRSRRNSIAQSLENAGLLDHLSTEAIKQDTPALYYGLHLGCSWVALGIFVLLAILVIWLLAKSQRSFRRALEGIGIVLILLGLLRTVPALLAKLLPDFWQTILGGNYLLSAVTGEILFSHILIPSTAALGVGVVLTLICGLIRSIRKKRLAAAERAE